MADDTEQAIEQLRALPPERQALLLKQIPPDKQQEILGRLTTKQSPSFSERIGERIHGNLDPMNLLKAGTEAATRIGDWVDQPSQPMHFGNPITNLKKSFGTVMPRVGESLVKAFSQYKDPANIVGDILTGAITHTATTGKVPFEEGIKKLPEAIAKHEAKVAAELNTKALKPANMQKPAGEAVAKAKIWGSKRTLPALIRKAINQNTAKVAQAVQAADQSGVKIDLSKDLDAVVDAARQRPAFMGDKAALADIAKWKDNLSNPIDPKTGTPIPRDWSKLPPSQVLELSRGLEKSAGWEGSPPKHIQSLATEFRKKAGEGLDKASPGVAELRRQNSGLIEAEKAAKAIADRSLKEQITFAKHWLSAPNMSKLALSFVTIEMLKEAGMPYLGAAGAVIGLRAMGESMTSRTARAALHQTIAEIMTGQRPPVARSAAAGPKMGGGPSVVPQAPISPPSAPVSPQVQQTKALTAGTPPAAPAAVSQKIAPSPVVEAEPQAAPVSPKVDVMADTAAKLQEKIDFGKTAAERSAAKKNLDQLHQAIAAGDDATQKAVARKVKVAGYQAKVREKGIAEATPAKSTGAPSEPVAPNLSPEEMAISLEDGYRRLQAIGKTNITIGKENVAIDSSILAKKLRADAVKLRMSSEEELAAINEVLDKLKGGVK